MSQHPAGLAHPANQGGQERLFTVNFLLASMATLSSFSSFYLLLATLPVYVVKVCGGTEAEVGLVMGIFSAVAVVLRPFVGRSADSHGTKPLILLGTFILTVCSALYNLAGTIPLLLGLRLLHGVGWSSFGTSTNTLVANLAPRNSRGAAMGYYGMFSNLAMAVGPAAGVMLMVSYNFSVLFYASAAMALIALFLAIAIREPQRTAPSNGSRGQGGIIERTALFPSTVLALTAVTYGSIVSFVPLYAGKHGIDNPGLFFTIYAITLIASRGVTGQLSDRYGRAAVIVPGLAMAAVGLWVMALASSLPMFLLVAVLYGLAFASVQPALMALVVDRAPAARRGAAMGTLSAAMDLGIGSGSVIWGVVAQTAGYEAMYVASGVVALVALVVFVAGARTQNVGRPARQP